MKEWVDVKAIRALWISFIVFAALYVSAAVWPVSLTVRQTVLAIAYLLPTGAAAIGTLVVALVHRDRERLYWACLSTSLVFFFIGEAYWAFLQATKGVEGVENLSFASFAFLTGYGLLFISLAALAWIKPTRYGFWHNVMAVTCLMAMGMLATWFLQSAALYSAYIHLERTSEIINVFYPVLDVGLAIGLASLAVIKYTFKWPPWLVSIFIGIIIYAFGDTTFSYFSLAGAYDSGTFLPNIIDVLWMACYVFILNGALARMRITGDGEYETAVSSIR